MEQTAENQPNLDAQPLNQTTENQPQPIVGELDYLFGKGQEGVSNSQIENFGLNDDERVTFEQLLGKVSNGSIKNANQFNQTLQQASQSESTRKELENARENAKKSVFANDFSKKINDLAANGATHEEIKLFMDAQSLDLGNMSNVNLVRNHILRQYGKNLSSEQIDEHISETYGSLEESEMSGSKKISLINAAKEARDFLAAQKAQTENPTRLREQNEGAKRQEEFISSFQPKLAQALLNNGKFDFFISNELGSYSLPLKGKNQQEQAEINSAIEMASSHAAMSVLQNKIDPNSNEGKIFVRESIKKALLYNYGEKIIAELAEQVMKATTKDLKLKNHNIQPINIPNPPKTSDSTKNSKEISLDDFKKRMEKRF
jgi:hypothetical protein